MYNPYLRQQWQAQEAVKHRHQQLREKIRDLQRSSLKDMMRQRNQVAMYDTDIS
jgi:hypothetical protein